MREPSKKNSTKRDVIQKEYPIKKKPSKKSTPKQDIFQEEDLLDNPVLQPKKRKTSPLVSSPLLQHAPLVSSPLLQDAPLVEAVVPTGKRIMTSEEKYELSARLQSYGALLPDHVVEFIRSHADDCDVDEEELELDMDALGDDTLFELQKLLDDHDRVNPSRNLTEEDPHEVEVGVIVLEVAISLVILVNNFYVLFNSLRINTSSSIHQYVMKKVCYPAHLLIYDTYC
jgi:hypothetical protein